MQTDGNAICSKEEMVQLLKTLEDIGTPAQRGKIAEFLRSTKHLSVLWGPKGPPPKPSVKWTIPMLPPVFQSSVLVEGAGWAGGGGVGDRCGVVSSSPQRAASTGS